MYHFWGFLFPPCSCRRPPPPPPPPRGPRGYGVPSAFPRDPPHHPAPTCPHPQPPKWRPCERVGAPPSPLAPSLVPSYATSGGVGVVVVLAVPLQVGIGGAVLPKHVVTDHVDAVHVVAVSSGGSAIDLFLLLLGLAGRVRRASGSCYSARKHARRHVCCSPHTPRPGPLLAVLFVRDAIVVERGRVLVRRRGEARARARLRLK